MEMDEMLIWSFAILCIVSAIYWFFIKKKSTNTNNQSQSGSQQSVTGKKSKDYAWVLYTVIAVIVLIGVWKIAESSVYSDDVVKFHLSELEHAYGPFHTPARKQASFESPQGVTFKIRNDETDWVLVGPGLPPPDLFKKCGCNSRNLWFKINELDDHDFDIQITYEPVDKKFDAMNLK